MPLQLPLVDVRQLLPVAAVCSRRLGMRRLQVIVAAGGLHLLRAQQGLNHAHDLCSMTLMVNAAADG